MSFRTDIEDAFKAQADAIAAVKVAYTKTPEEMSELPAVTMLRTRHAKDKVDLGIFFDHTWEWTVSVYVSLQAGYQAAQDALEEIATALIDAVQADPRLNGTADDAKLFDVRDPRFEKEEGQRYAIKELTLRAFKYGP